jgi:hypothetical protein
MNAKFYLDFIKWSAQTIGFFTSTSLVIYLLTDVFPGIRSGRADAFIPLLPLIALGLLGFVISWYRELAGATMLLAGGTATVLYVLLAVQNQEAAMILGLPLAVSGALYLLHWFWQFGIHQHHKRVKH